MCLLNLDLLAFFRSLRVRKVFFTNTSQVGTGSLKFSSSWLREIGKPVRSVVCRSGLMNILPLGSRYVDTNLGMDGGTYERGARSLGVAGSIC